jgi:hypothetical protein
VKKKGNDVMAAPQKYRKIRAFATFSPPRGIDKRVYLVLRMLRRGIKGYCSMNETIEKPSWIGDAILLQLAAERGGRTGESHSEAPRVEGRHFTE